MNRRRESFRKIELMLDYLNWMIKLKDLNCSQTLGIMSQVFQCNSTSAMSIPNRDTLRNSVTKEQ